MTTKTFLFSVKSYKSCESWFFPGSFLLLSSYFPGSFLTLKVKVLVMKIMGLSLIFPFIIFAFSDADNTPRTSAGGDENTLLWKITGNGLSSPSYLFGTMHMVCREDAVLSDSLLAAIRNTEQVYFEVDMDNLMELMGVMSSMAMKNDTTLADLVSKENYDKLKQWFETKNSILPFSVIETYKPLLAASTVMESEMKCDAVAMEQVIMQEAKSHGKRVNGLESMAYQLSIFDSIPYKIQAEQLLSYIDNEGKGGDSEFDKMVEAYKEQDLEKLAEMIAKSDIGISKFQDLLLNNRNRNWVTKMKSIMNSTPILVAVGAGHLPGPQGVINLLRKEGFTVTPVINKTRKQTII